MLYHILYPLAEYHIIFNVFQYITFRAIGAFITAILISFIFGPKIIKLLKKHEVTESIDILLPASHQKKKGTPTMGGIIIGLGLIIASLLWNNLTNPYVLIAILASLWLGGLGFLDDYLKNVRKIKQGLVERYKISGQFVLGLLIAFILYLGYEKTNAISQISIPFFKNTSISLGVFFIPFVVLFITFYSNAVNLTDGLDGLAPGSIALVAFGLGIMSYIKGNIIIADYLKIEFISHAGELTIFTSAIMGTILGFLWFNVKPASIFMGDTGALSMGGILAILAILLKEEVFFIIISILFVVEAVSSLTQRFYYRHTRIKTGEGKRVFLCAPLHHHFELKGWSESQIVVRFWIITMLFLAIGFATLKLR
ncbi:MAG: phospho-N-acetylmuramoyl-pentapeptide-transferase [Candidatus Cloacimonetes bacterium]|nr:phospho-N-acetylmuramoyl-pentapeptide-transferase [Candidatus Cloacimonadota bacterium]MBL7086994.1 phospho-N-acetylmuramoyl-pentapeptide-transferase [Candidatus Cloacimonadota bacterium]